ncbi:hypothetical protein Z517_06578 [Fonsecaea pedrosoi CBS 271.37]|uniref:Uncharacterized protein n=1 Tax=Fonsecaea pedrosoi CBS 271.37 TaxID=1442368 RepID=A0A0D2GGQ3_9EURO|nr:uncharacterized protein Z517_06578 [Fonsecaea pedrosoi CBS 271.37]KIW79963.1 hypothetical protein Z517_06578 [Fonsecaea pedrosoi CBS 271.37]
MSLTSSPPPPLTPPDDDDTALSAPSASFVSLKYAPSQKCICANRAESELATSLCPQHGYHDSKSKIVIQKNSYGVGDAQKRGRDTQDRHDNSAQGRVRKRKNTPEFRPQRSRTPLYSRYPLGTNNAGMGAVGAFTAELGLMNDNLHRMLTHPSASDEHIHSVQFSERLPLKQIDFLEWPLEARKLIYRFLLVPAKRSVIFPDKDSNDTFRQLNPDLNARILQTNSQVYREARTILYGENTFVGAEPSDFFFPTSIQGLRASTAARIKHLSFVRKGTGPTLCDIDSNVLSTSILSLIQQCPAFLLLKTLTIRFEVIRPLTVNMFNLQVQYANNGIGSNIKSAYNKTEVATKAAAKVAYRALRKKSPFQGLKEVANRFESVWDPSKDGAIKHVIEMCLFRTEEPRVEYQEHSQMLREAILDMLFEEKERDVDGADMRFQNFMKLCPE